MVIKIIKQENARMFRGSLLKFGFRLVPAIDHLGRFLRRHWFAPDNKEFPSNRNKDDWYKQLASGKPLAMTAHGSKEDIHEQGHIIFVPEQYGVLEENQRQREDEICQEPAPLLQIGPYCDHPYTPKSIFNISAMSHGSLGDNAIMTLSRGAILAECWLNTGEGGLAPEHLVGGSDLIFQIGTAKYGVCVPDKPCLLNDDRLREVVSHPEVKMIEIKLNQGAKPGKGGILPGKKVTEKIAKIRGIKAGQDSISPNGHYEIRNDKDLLDFIARVRKIANIPVGIKTNYSSVHHIERLFQEITRRGIESAPDYIAADGGEGGSGAAPNILMNNFGISIQDTLPMLTEMLVKYGLRDRIRIIASGGLGTSDAASWALCAGADFINAARGVKKAMGCVGAQECHENTCPRGITTHDPVLQALLDPDIVHREVANYMRGVRNEIDVAAHSAGLAHPRQFRPHHVNINEADGHPKLLSEKYPNLRFGDPLPKLKV